MQGKSFITNIIKGATKTSQKIFKNKYNEIGLNFIDIKILKHLPPGKKYTKKIGANTIHFSDPQELLHALREIFIEKIYDQSLPENATIIDCGSNIGISILYLKQIAPSASIIGFEPDDQNFELLEKNITANKLENIHVYKAAVWKENTTLFFEVTGSMGSAITTDTDGRNTVNVKAVRLKEYLKKNIDFLKIDIEGAEYDVLKDIAPELLNVKKLFIEYHGTYQQNNELLEMLNIVHSAGFSFYIKEAASIYDRPFVAKNNGTGNYDVQLNIFCNRG
jgi:FkbM family methyltransferase